MDKDFTRRGVLLAGGATKLFNSRLLSVKLSMTSKFNRNPTKLVLRMMPQISAPSRNGRIPMSDTSRLLIVSSNRRVLSSSILGSHRNGRGIDFTHVGETISLGLCTIPMAFYGNGWVFIFAGA